MIDVHCHLLPGIDDGPPDIFSALDLARQAVEDGVTHCIVTPHIHEGRWQNTKLQIQKAVADFRAQLALASIPLTIGYAAEVRIGTEILTLLPENKIPFLGSWEGRRVVLLEMPHSHIVPGTDKIISWLMNHGVMPMIAHPERNKDVIRRFDKLKPLIELGCLFQVTAGALTGQFGSKAMDRAHKLLELGVVTVLASDAHHVKRRPVNLSTGRDAVIDIMGSKLANALVYENPLKMVGEQFTVGSFHNDVSFLTRP